MEVQAPVVAARAADLLACLGALGCLTMLAAVVPADLRRAPPVAALRRLAGVSLLAGLLAGAIWTLVQAACFAGAPDLRAALAAVPATLTDTRFGTVMIARAAFLITALAMLALRRDRMAAVAAGCACAGQPWLGHPAAIGIAWLPFASALHVLAAGIWIGGLPPLARLVSALPAAAAVRVLRRFSTLAAGCVGVLALTALAQAVPLVGGPRGLVAGAYGGVVLLKAGLFVVMLGCAAANRLLFTRALAAGGAGARRALGRCIAVEALLGLTALLAAALLAELPASAMVMG